MLKQDQIENIRYLLVDKKISTREISRTTGFSIATVYKYQKIYSSSHLDRSITSGLPVKLEQFASLIDDLLKKGVNNATKIYQNIKNHGYRGSYSLVNKYVNTKKIKQGLPKKQMYQKVETGPGEQAQVDWGHFGKIQIDGQKYNLYVFVYILSYSRMMYAEFVTSQKQQVLEQCHMNAFDIIGAVKKVRYDNMKTVVSSRRKINGHEYINYNFDFLNFAKYYKFEPEACPLYYPRSKGKVESGIKYIRYNFWPGQKFGKTYNNLTELNENLYKWLDKIANSRIHATTQQQPKRRWLEEKKYLLITSEYPRYQNKIRSFRRASQNSMVTYRRSAYWVPNEYARKKVDVVEGYDNGVKKLYFYSHASGNKIIEHEASNKIGGWVLPKSKERPRNEKINKIKNKIFSVEVQERELTYYNQFIN